MASMIESFIASRVSMRSTGRGAGGRLEINHRRVTITKRHHTTCSGPQLPACAPQALEFRAMSFTFEMNSSLHALPDVVWAHASTMDGVNAELAPFVRMSVPSHVRGLRLDDAPRGEEAFVSSLLAFGVLPFDRHHLTLVSVSERGFVEESWSLLQRRWRHERSIEPTSDGCIVTDRLEVEPRFVPDVLVRPLVRALFEARHRELRRRFGAPSRVASEAA